MIGWLSGVASASSFQILIVLSASPVISREPERSKAHEKMPRSDSSDPGCAIVSSVWKLYLGGG